MNEVVDGVGKQGDNLQQTWKKKPGLMAAKLHRINQRRYHDVWKLRQ